MALLKKTGDRIKLARAEKNKTEIENCISKLEIDIKICESDVASLSQRIKETSNQSDLEKYAYTLKRREKELESSKVRYRKEQDKLSIIEAQITELNSRIESTKLNVKEISAEVKENIVESVAEQETIHESCSEIERAQQHRGEKSVMDESIANIIQKAKSNYEPEDSLPEKSDSGNEIESDSVVQMTVQKKNQRKQFE